MLSGVLCFLGIIIPTWFLFINRFTNFFFNPELFPELWKGFRITWLWSYTEFTKMSLSPVLVTGTTILHKTYLPQELVQFRESKADLPSQEERLGLADTFIILSAGMVHGWLRMSKLSCVVTLNVGSLLYVNSIPMKLLKKTSLDLKYCSFLHLKFIILFSFLRFHQSVILLSQILWSEQC